MTGQVEAYYDRFSRKFVNDIVDGNDRIAQQLHFLSRAIPHTVRSALVLGCGSGESAHYIATTVCRAAKVLAVDISSENVKLANCFFPHPRIEYRQSDVVADDIEGEWDVIVFPDVYEHIPKASRPVLHQRLKRLLALDGRVLFTVPSPGKQASLYATGVGLQVVDEVVTIEDLSLVGRDIGGVLTYFSMVSIFETNDYIHALVEREIEPVRPIQEADKLPIKGWIPRGLSQRVKDALGYRLGFYRLSQNWRRRRVSRRIAQLNWRA